MTNKGESPENAFHLRNAGDHNCPSTGLLLDKCVHDMSCLLSGTSHAIKNVTELTLTVHRHHLVRHRGGAPTYVSLRSAPSGVGEHYLAPRKVFALLAAAVPNIKSLSLSTQYGDVDLSVFAMHCPSLRSLSWKSDASALQGIDIALPNLTSLHLSIGYDFMSFVNDLEKNVQQASMLLHGCSNLTHLTMFFISNTYTWQQEFSSRVWEQLPVSLTEFSCNARFCYLICAKAFMSRLRVLTLGQLPEECSHFANFLHYAPNLSKLSICSGLSMDHELELLWEKQPAKDREASFKARMLEGFQLDAERVSLTGSPRSITDMMTWLSPLYGTAAIRFHFNTIKDSSLLECVSSLPRVCPGVQYLVFENDLVGEVGPLFDKDSFAVLSECKQLVRLDMYLDVKFTQSWLFSLFMSLPSLRWLYFQSCDGVCIEDIMTELASKGKNVEISEIDLMPDRPPHYY